MKKKVIIIILVLFFIIALAVLGAIGYKKYFEKPIVEEPEEIKEEPIVVEKTVQTFKGNDRPIAVMIDNNTNASPRAGLNKAYMVYEMIVEGGESRLMALFKGVNLENIGPVRSSRHYFLDYALENDAIYVHFGWSPQAQKDIRTLEIANINGIADDDAFWRTNKKQAPHNALTSTERILKVAETKGYRTTSDVSSVLNYSVDEVELKNGDAQIAETVKIPYSLSNSVEWKYNNELKVYERYTKGKPELDFDTEEQVTAKNIIIEFVRNSTISGDSVGRQTLDNLGNIEGYYITNGKAIKINCAKTTRRSKTEYTDMNGNQIKVNDGNTFVQICPIDSKVEIEENETQE